MWKPPEVVLASSPLPARGFRIIALEFRICKRLNIPQTRKRKASRPIMPRLMTQFERARNLISQPPEKRMEHEILQLVPWLRSKAKLFKQLKSGSAYMVGWAPQCEKVEMVTQLMWAIHGWMGVSEGREADGGESAHPVGWRLPLFAIHAHGASKLLIAFSCNNSSGEIALKSRICPIRARSEMTAKPGYFEQPNPGYFEQPNPGYFEQPKPGYFEQPNPIHLVLENFQGD
ncbi:hypothetical protein RRG08_013483 [Elysia crispata]|uniref:Uncharacterized protein n=1 Tax=Elysia crispata TaxID=231223 RepID=A0AAE1CQF6_9GAST|nr:hypothetical protein RRG08_013483 [Elysia crispata]